MEQVVPMKLLVDPKAPEARSKVDRQDLYRMLGDLIRAQLYTGRSRDELVRTEVLRRNSQGQPLDERADYELRVQDFYISEDGVIGKMELRHLAGLCRAQFEECLGVVSREQPHADWRLVGARVEQINLRSTVRPAAKTVSGAPNIDAILSGGDWRLEAYEAEPVQQKQVPSYRAKVWLVFADVAQATIQSPNLMHGANADNPLKDYQEERLLRHLPLGLRLQRQEAVRILAEMDQAAALHETQDLALDVLTSEQLDAADRLVASGMTLAAAAQVMRVSLPELERALVALRKPAEEPPATKARKA